MKNKIVLVALITSVILSLSCQKNKIIYDVDEVSIHGLYVYNEKQFFLVFSTPLESLYYCDSVNMNSNSNDELRLSFYRSGINEKEKKGNYITEYVKDNPILSEKFRLDPKYHFIVLDKKTKEFVIEDSKSKRRVPVTSIRL